MSEVQRQKYPNVGVILIARQTSSRLPNKVLKKINGKTILEIILEKVQEVSDNYIFAVPDTPGNSGLRNFLDLKGLNYLAGSESNVLDRFVKASTELTTPYVQRLNCDNLLFDPEYFKRCYEEIEYSHSIFTNVKRCENHSGASVEIVEKSKCLLDREPNEYEKEHVFPYFYNNEDLLIKHLTCPEGESIFPIDTEADFQKAEALLDD